ncbi:hypothetical protein C8R44DRAFT_725486 [Mycena epipterygia]|nr:hypothetical protein C8R44DRAFT_725486 [Mycena epipterygia]
MAVKIPRTRLVMEVGETKDVETSQTERQDAWECVQESLFARENPKGHEIEQSEGISSRNPKDVSAGWRAGHPPSHHSLVAAIKDGRRRRLPPFPTPPINPIKSPAAAAQLTRSGCKNQDKFAKKLGYMALGVPGLGGIVARYTHDGHEGLCEAAILVVAPLLLLIVISVQRGPVILRTWRWRWRAHLCVPIPRDRRVALPADADAWEDVTCEARLLAQLH